MQNIINKLQQELHDIYPEAEIKSISYLILEKLSGLSRTQLIINKNTLFSDEQLQIVEIFIEKLKKHVPIQYILGETDFFGLSFIVNEAVLIPRPETEELVYWINNEHNKNAKLQILDIGTGSGCIAIALKQHFENATVTAFDISEEALEIAKKNAIKNNQSVIFEKIDILANNTFQNKWDIIVSNPPYVLENEKKNMCANVLDYEPHLALFVSDNDPLLYYSHILFFAKKHLLPYGKLYFEINREYGQEIVNLLVNNGFTAIELRKDISGNDRMICASYNA